MADNTASLSAKGSSDTGAVPTVTIPASRKYIDFATLLGLVFSFALIFFAIAAGASNASFINGPAIMIVIFGTMTATAISYTGQEILHAGQVLKQSLFRKVYRPRSLAKSLVDIAVVAKKKGLLALSALEGTLQKEPFLAHAIQMAVDGGKPEDIELILSQESSFLIERHKRTASMTRRASEVAPAMGLIGTLVGLVQMLADLENPDTIGPAMAVALLTTFYGAILGTVVMAPLAVKLEKNSHDEILIKTMIKLAAVSIAKQDNPRKLEMELNSALPPSEQIKYFD